MALDMLVILMGLVVLVQYIHQKVYVSTNYYNRNSGYSRTETYTPQRNDTYYNGGGYNSRPRSRKGYGYSSGDYFGF